MFLWKDFKCLLSSTGSHWVPGPPWDPRSTWESGMYLSKLEGGPHTSPDHLTLNPTILLLIHTNATHVPLGFPEPCPRISCP